MDLNLGGASGEEDHLAQLLIDEAEELLSVHTPSESVDSSSAMGGTGTVATTYDPGHSAIGVTYTYDGTSMTQGSTTYGQYRREDAMDWELQPNIETNLAINQAYQELLDNLILRVEMGLGRVRERQKVLQTSVKDTNAALPGAKKKVPAIQFLPPYFKDLAGMAPPHNPDKRLKLEAGEFDPLVKESKKWTKTELESLKNAVRSSLIEARLVSAMTRKELLQEKIAGSGQHNSTNEIEAWKEELRTIGRTIAYTKNLKDGQLFTGDYSTVDWMKIASFDFKGTRTPDQCRLMWVNEQAPEWSKDKWSQAEMAQLKQLAEAQCTWDEIAVKLGTRRTAFQCFEKYQSELNEGMHKRNWTEEEDAQLRKVVDTLRNGSSIPWDQVSYYMEGRTRQQCNVRWRRSIDQNIKKGRWNEDEDLLLIGAVSKYGPRDWQKVADLVPGRTDAQCRERWCNALDSNNSMEPWTEQEDETLRCAVDVFGIGEWAQCSKLLKGRNPQACKMRFRSLTESGKKKRKSPQKKKRLRHESLGAEGLVSGDESDDDYEPQKTRTFCSASVRLILPQSPRARKAPLIPPHLHRTRIAKMKKERVRQQFEALTGIPANEMKAETNNNVDDVLAGLSDEMRRLVKLKLDLIKFKHAKEPALARDTDALDIAGNVVPLVARRRETSAPPMCERVPEEAEKDEMAVAREEIMCVDLEDALKDLIAECDKRTAVEKRTEHLDAYYVATKQLYENALSKLQAKMPTLPPSLGSAMGMYQLLHMESDLVQNAGRLYPTVDGQPLVKARNVKVTNKNDTGRKRRRTLSNLNRPLYDQMLASQAKQRLDIQLPDGVLQAPQYQLLQDRANAVFTWPTLLEQVKDQTTDDLLLPRNFLPKRPVPKPDMTWAVLLTKLPKDAEDFALPTDFMSKNK